MAATLVTSELMKGIGTLTSVSPGNLGTVTGTFYKRAGGPKLASDSSIGGSCDLRMPTVNSAVSHYLTLGTTPAMGMMRQWYFLNNYVVQGGNKLELGGLASGTGSVAPTHGVINLDPSTGHFSVQRQNSGGFGYIDTGIAYAPMQYKWVEFTYAFNRSAAQMYAVSMYMRYAGTSVYTLLTSGTFGVTGSFELNALLGGCANSLGTQGQFQGRYGGFAYYTITDFANDPITPDATMADPVTPVAWSVDPILGGSESTVDGVTTPFASNADLIAMQSFNGGFFGTPAPATITASSLSMVKGNATVAATAHGMSNGDTFQVTGASPAWLNGAATVYNATTNAFNFTPASAPIPYVNVSGIALTATGTIKLAPMAKGDTVSIKATSAAPLDLLTASLSIATRGLIVKAATGQSSAVLKAWKDISAASSTWTLTSGLTKTYQTTDSSASDLAAIVPWENDKFLNHQIGASDLVVDATTNTKVTSASYSFVSGDVGKILFVGSTSGGWTYGQYTISSVSSGAATLATSPGSVGSTGGIFATQNQVLPKVDATAGSFWTDGTTIWLHPFGDTNPASDGKTYTRSRARASQNSAVMISALDVQLFGINVGKTCIADPSSNDPGSNYGIQCTPGSGGTSRISACTVYYASKHGIGNTNNASNEFFLVDNCDAEQGSPYVGFGGYTAFVSFNGNSSGAGNVHNYVSCTTLKVLGLIGSTAGQTNLGTQSFYCHGSSSAPYAVINFIYPNFDMVIENTLAPGAVFGGTSGGVINEGSGAVTVDRHKTTIHGVCNAGSGSITATSSIFTYSGSISATNTTWITVQGLVALYGCTIDASAVTITDTNNPGVMYRTGALTFIGEDLIFLNSGASTGATLIANALSTDTITLDHNAYQQVAGGAIFTNYNDGSTATNRSLAQAISLGKESSSSMSATSLGLSASGVPQAGSIVLNAGASISQTAGLPGYDGRSRPSSGSVDIGAIQAARAGGFWVTCGGV